MISISLCMIVKNEEAVLRRCLDSIADMMDEIIIVDTGSADSTKSIAAEYTDKIYDFTWINDFAAARNFSFSKATKDYIYVADADEWIDEENRRNFWDLKRAMLPEIEIVQMKYCNQLEYGTTYNFDVEYRGKLFKRVREFVWEDAIHETVRTDPIIYDSEVSIIHQPASCHSVRDFSIFDKLIKSGNRISNKLHGLYARELFIMGEDQDFLNGEDFFTKSITDEGRNLAEIKEASCVLTKVYRLKKDVDKFFRFVIKDIVSEPSSEVCFELGEYYFSMREYEEAAIWYYNAAYEAKSILNIHYMGDLPLNRLAACYKMLGEREQEENFRKAAAEWKIPSLEET